MSMMIDPMNERYTAPDPDKAENVGHHGSRLSSPLLAFLLLLAVGGIILVIALTAG
jgi:hypothetical protein